MKRLLTIVVAVVMLSCASENTTHEPPPKKEKQGRMLLNKDFNDNYHAQIVDGNCIIGRYLINEVEGGDGVHEFDGGSSTTLFLKIKDINTIVPDSTYNLVSDPFVVKLEHIDDPGGYEITEYKNLRGDLTLLEYVEGESMTWAIEIVELFGSSEYPQLDKEVKFVK